MANASPVVITVRGEKDIEVAPELALVSITVRAEGDERGPLIDPVQRSAAVVVADLDEFKLTGALDSWWNRGLRVGDYTQYGDNGKNRVVQFAEVAFTATFGDFQVLNDYVASRVDDVLIRFTGVTWQITPETRRAKEAEAAAGAVGIAMARATAFANAAGRSEVVPEQIADVGLLQEGGGHRPPTGRAYAASAPAMACAEAVPDFLREPEYLVVSSEVECRFLAS